MTTQFEDIYHNFTKTSYWHHMLMTQENSPYHREENTAVHTQMTLRFYKEHFFLNRSENERLLSQLALLFHDVGKPKCEVEKFTEKRGQHKSYAGHELVSARIFEDYVLSNNNFGLTDLQIRQVRWMIENHLPYGRKCYNDFRIDSTRALTGNLQMFADVLLSDAGGRITEDSKIPFVTNWVNETLYLQEQDQKHNSGLTAYILVGPSGSGKSTVSEKLMQDANTVIFSFDNYRIEYYSNIFPEHTTNIKELYKQAWNYCNEHAEKFNEYTRKKFNEFIKQNKNIIIDNTNLSPKSRRQWVTILRQHNYYIIGFEFMSPLYLLEQRIHQREDKTMSLEVVTNQYYSTQSIRYSEVDSIRIINNTRG